MSDAAGFEAAAGDECGERLDEVFVEGAFEFAGAVFGAGAVVEKELAGLGGDFKAEGAKPHAGVDVFAEVVDLVVEDGVEGGLVERVVGADDIDAVDEFGGELFADGGEGNGVQFFVNGAGCGAIEDGVEAE